MNVVIFTQLQCFLTIQKQGGLDLSKLMPNMRTFKMAMDFLKCVTLCCVFHGIAYVYFYGVLRRYWQNSYKFGIILAVVK